MNIIDVYLFRAILKATIVVGFVFASLSLFVDFVSQSDDIGVGSYGVYEAIQYFNEVTQFVNEIHANHYIDWSIGGPWQLRKKQ